jgi:cardiolipin synthase
VNYADDEILEFKAQLPKELATVEKLVTKISSYPFTNNNALELLIDGEQTFAQMLKAIAIAQDYILLQSYIIRNDEIGNIFKSALIAKARDGVRIYLLYDALGTRKLDRAYLKSLRQNGIAVSSFCSTKGKGNRFQLNFRNHRKILVVDGHTGFMGGLNIGDEYLGKNTRFEAWRDTHLKIKGTNVKSLQRTFLQDWYWATKKIPQVSWSIAKKDSYDQTALVLATGPADRLEVCTLFLLNLIDSARDKLWIASPYFVPDDSTLNALKLAALRGVDVRIILPDRPDHLLVYLCSFSFYTELQKVGIKLYRYRSGFMHQKIFLCDCIMAGVGTVNLDNRSLLLNFEVMTFGIKSDYQQNVIASDLVENVEKMLLNDLNASRLIDLEEYQQKPFWFKLSAEVSRLLAPIL